MSVGSDTINSDTGLINLDHARSFLNKIWLYTSADATVFEFVIIGSGVRVKQVEGYVRIGEGLEWVRENAGPGSSVYYGVLPRAARAKKGRGKAQDVKVGRWLWADLDYKEPVEAGEFEGCRELEDSRLICYYEEGGKVIKVDRPPLSRILDKLEEIGLEPTIVVDSGAGYHLYWELTEEIDAKQLSRLEDKLIGYLKELGLPVDPQTRDLARILRLPGSVNPRVNRPARVIKWGDKIYSPEELEAKVSRPRVGGSGRPGELRELEDSKLLRLKELLREAYKPGYRQYLILYLSGWMAKAGINPLSTVKLVKMLYEETGDQDPLKTRLSAVVYSYKKAGIDIDQYAGEIEELTGVKPYGLEREIDEALVKGRTGLQEILEDTLGEERALEAVREIEEILGVSSPFRDSIIEILDYEKQLYAIANLRQLVVVRGVRQDNRLKYKERVTVGAPTTVEVYVNPIGGLTKYRVRWETPTRPRPLEIGPAPIEDIVNRLIAEGLIVNKKLAHDVINAIIEGFIRKGKAVVKTEIEAPGFYLVDGKVVAVRVETGRPGPEELKESLVFLNELADTWFSHVRERFSLVVKWGLLAPFSYVYKQKGKWMPWLYMYGSSYTGKTTLGDIILSTWGLDSRYRKAGSNIDTPARIGYVLSQSTFPVLVNEPGAAIIREDIIEIIKNAVESPIARGRYERGSYTDIQALAPLIFTSNKVLPRDDALLRRLLVVRFTYGERISPEKAREFEERVKPQLSRLRALGRYAATVILEKPEILDQEWEKAAITLLEMAYREVGLEPPSWIFEKPRLEENIYEDMREAIRNFLVERINEAYFKAAGRVTVSTSETIEFKSRLDVDFEKRLETVLTSRLIPWLILKRSEVDGEEDTVVFTAGFIQELRPIAGDIGGLKSVAELLGWEYKPVKIGRDVVKGMTTRLKELLEFLNP